MADRPIIFSAPMVRALLDGRKIQTRRVIRDEVPAAPAFDNVVHKPRHAAPYLDAYCGERKTPANPRGMGPWWCWWTRDDRCGAQFQVGYVPGDRLWVREAHSLRVTPEAATDGIGRVWFRADPEWGDEVRWRSPIHMPRWASRLTLNVTDVRVQRLQGISEDDAIAEGLEVAPQCAIDLHNGGFTPGYFVDLADVGRVGGTVQPTRVYRMLWNSLHGPHAWSANPWVVALTFTVEQRNIDALREAA